MFISSDEKVNDLALKYLEEKYEEKFEYSSPAGISMSGTRSFYATCASLGEESVLVQIDNYKDKENRVFRDNYLAVKYRSRTSEFLEECASEKFSQAKVFLNIGFMALSPDIPASASFEDYLADSDCYLSVLIGVKQSDFTNREQLSTAASAISNACGGRSLSILIIVVKDSEFETLDEKALEEKSMKDDFVICAELTRNDGFNDFRVYGGE